MTVDRERYALQAKLPRFRRLVDRTLATIQRSLSEAPGPWAVSYSGGKDSTALLDLCVRAGWRGPLGTVAFGAETFPGNAEMVDWAASHYGLELIRHDGPGEFDVMREVGHFFLHPETREERAAVRRWQDQTYDALNRLLVSRGCIGHFWGLRKLESRHRKILLASRGQDFYAASHGMRVCTPLANWTAADVWGYLVSEGLPWSPVYDAPGDCERTRNEFVVFAGGRANEYGALAELRMRFPAYFAALAREWPELARYT